MLAHVGEIESAGQRCGDGSEVEAHGRCAGNEVGAPGVEPVHFITALAVVVGNPHSCASIGQPGVFFGFFLEPDGHAAWIVELEHGLVRAAAHFAGKAPVGNDHVANHASIAVPLDLDHLFRPGAFLAAGKCHGQRGQQQAADAETADKITPMPVAHG
jgi:hypothetical protein